MARRTTQKSARSERVADRAAAGAEPTPKGPRRRGPGRPPRHETAETDDRFPGARVIKRYGNRRLYDPSLSRCVTMEEIAEFIRKGDDVRVVDGDNGEDVTRRVFTQIILEQSNAQKLELMPVELLRRMISLRNDHLSKWLEQYLSAGATFLERQMASAGPAAKVMKESVESMLPWLKPESWQPFFAERPEPGDDEMTEQAAGDAVKNAVDAEGEVVQSEIDDLKRRLADLSARVKRK